MSWGSCTIRPEALGDRRVALRLGVVVALFLLLVGQARVTVFDGGSMLAVAQSVVHRGSLAVPPGRGVPGHDGVTQYSKYGLLLPVLSIVPVALAQPIGAITGRVQLVEAAAAASLMPLFTGALVAALYLLGRRLAHRAPPPRGRGRHRSRNVPAALRSRLLRRAARGPALVLMVERALAGRGLQAGTALGLAVLARPQSALLAPLLFGYLLLRGGGIAAERARCRRS